MTDAYMTTIVTENTVWVLNDWDNTYERCPRPGSTPSVSHNMSGRFLRREFLHRFGGVRLVLTLHTGEELCSGILSTPTVNA